MIEKPWPCECVAVLGTEFEMAYESLPPPSERIPTPATAAPCPRTCEAVAPCPVIL
jgi:hypothetical protein